MLKAVALSKDETTMTKYVMFTLVKFNEANHIQVQNSVSTSRLNNLSLSD